MRYDPPLIKGYLVKRYKRFLANIVFKDDDGENINTVHCPNTGSMKGCQSPNAKVWCSVSDNPKRKYSMTWELVEEVNDSSMSSKVPPYLVVTQTCA